MQKSCRAGILLAWAVLCLALPGRTAAAQEIPARQQGLSLQAFGLFSYVQPHYDPSNNVGGAFGADLNFRPLYFLQPSVDVRATFAPGSDVSETSYDFGPRLEADFGRLKPYGYILIGTGSITFTHPVIYPTGPYTHDSSIVYSGGFGADYMVTPQIGIRGEIMIQSWNLGSTGSMDNISFHPRIYSMGVDYRFNFNHVRRNRQ